MKTKRKYQIGENVKKLSIPEIWKKYGRKLNDKNVLIVEAYDAETKVPLYGLIFKLKGKLALQLQDNYIPIVYGNRKLKVIGIEENTYKVKIKYNIYPQGTIEDKIRTIERLKEEIAKLLKESVQQRQEILALKNQPKISWLKYIWS